MRSLIVLIAVATFVVAAGVSPALKQPARLPLQSSAETRAASVVVPSVVYGGYFVSNEFKPKVADSFIVIKDQAVFDRVFGVAAVMFDRSRRLPANAFRTSIVVAAIHRGHANVTYHNVQATREGTMLRISYTTKEEQTPLTEYACPLILSVPRDNYSVVSFVENDKPVKSVSLTATRV